MESMFSVFLSSLSFVFHPTTLIIMIIGLVVGIIGGMIPGITTVTAIALFIPFTFSMPPTLALAALGAVYCGAMYGGANAAILINTPGAPGSIATALDGYPMTLKGRAPEALFMALLASCFGGFVGAVMLLAFFEPLASLALNFGSEAFFWMAIFGLSTLAAMSPGMVTRSLLGGVLGLGLSTIGLDPSEGIPRFTFDYFDLLQGFDMIVLMTSLFSFSQMLLLLESRDEYIAKYKPQPGAFMASVKTLFVRNKLLASISSIAGAFIGGLPGAGGSVAAIITYNEAKRWDKNPDRYGSGIPEGVMVPESANNASVGGALVPLLSLGIPGSAAAAVLMGGLLAQGLAPGPQLMEMHPDIAYGFIYSLIFANILMLPVGYVLARGCTKILDVPKLYVIPAIITLSIIGSYSLRNSMFDVLVLIVAGRVSYLLLKAKIQPACVALGVVLGPIVEENLINTLVRARSDSSPLDLFVFSPLSMTFIVLSVVALVLPTVMQRMKKGGQVQAAASSHFSLACLGRYDFWVVVVLTAVSVFFLWQSQLLNGEAGIFPTVVFGLMILLGLMVLAMDFFDSAPRKPLWSSPAALGNVAMYFVLSMATYALIEFLGFYSALFLCVVAMILFGLRYIRHEGLTARNLAKAVVIAALIILVEWLCFGLLVQVPAPTGLFI